MKIRLVLMMILFLLAVPAESQILKKNVMKKTEKELFGHSRGGKDSKGREPRKVSKSKKKQEANQDRLKKNYYKSVRQSQKRTYDIQSPDVQERMKQNKKDTAMRDKQKKKNMKSANKKAGKKYK